MAKPDDADLARKLYDLLREHGLPEETTSFSVHVALDSLVRIDCQFLATDRSRPA